MDYLVFVSGTLIGARSGECTRRAAFTEPEHQWNL
jgi:hypothetical protein